MKTLVFLHTVATLIEPFERLAKDRLPGVKTFHMLDEPLLAAVRQHGGLEWGSLSGDGLVRLGDHVSFAEEIGADAMLVTCSSLSMGVDRVGAEIPVIKIDEAMMENAARAGGRIGILATNETALEPARLALETAAANAGTTVQPQVQHVAGAFAALLDGDFATHDRLLIDAIRAMQNSVDGLLLAQASMARVLNAIPDLPVPVWTSPQTAIERARAVLGFSETH